MSHPVHSYGAHAQSILRIGLPLIGGHLAQIAIGVTDTIMLGWYGVDELAAVTIGGSYYFIFYLLGSGFALAVMPMVATYVAEGDETSARRVTRMGLWLSLLIGLLLMPVFLSVTPIMRLLGQAPLTAELAGQYLSISGFGIFPALLVMTLKSFLAALERTQVVFWMTVAAALANALANYALIFGNWGAPELGITGAALASIITQAVMLLCAALYAAWILPNYALFQRFWRPDWEAFGTVFRLGFPIGLTLVSESGMFTASAFMMGLLGTIPLAAHGIVLNISALTYMLHLGLSNVATIRAGNALGRRDVDHLARGARAVIVISICAAVLTTILFVTLPRPLIELFLDPAEPARDQIIALSVILLAMSALFQLVDGTQAVALGLLRGIKDTQRPMILAAVSYWGVGVPAAWLFGFTLGLEGAGIWLGLSVGLAVASVLLNLRFWRRLLPRI